MEVISNIITIRGGYVKAVKILEDFNDSKLNKEKLVSYFPNPDVRLAFNKIVESLHPTSSKRAKFISGTYGSGKSHFGLVIANYLIKNSSNNDFKYIWERIQEKDAFLAEKIINARNKDKRYLLVLLEGMDPDGIEHMLLKGLKDALIDPKRGNITENLLKTSYFSAIQKINNWKVNKIEFYKDLDQFLKKDGEDCETFILKLESFEEDALKKFKAAHFDITTSNFEALIGYKNVSTIYQEVCEEIRKRGFEGIAIIWDQFNDHLVKRTSSELGADVSVLRDFAEIVERSGENRILLFLISHNLPQAYLRGKISEERLENWITTEGRFDQLVLKAIEESEEIMNYIIIKDKEKKIWGEIEKKIVDTKILDFLVNNGFYTAKKKNWTWIKEIILKGLYPLHPITGYLLPRLSDVIGQEFRTMFTFFESNDEGGFTHYIKNTNILTSDDRLNYYYMDILFRFFKDSILLNPRTSIIIDNYNEALNNVEDPDDMLTQRILQALTIIDTIRIKEPNMPLLKIPEHISLILNEDHIEIKKLFEEFKSNGILWVKSNDEYEFSKGVVSYDFEKDLGDQKNSLNFDNPTNNLTISYPPYNLSAKKYAEEYYVRRSLQGYYILSDGLSNISQYKDGIENQYLDGIFLYVIIEDQKDIKNARDFAKSIKNAQILIGIPKNSITLFLYLKNILAFNELKKASPYNQKDSQPYAMLHDRLENEKKSIEDQLKTFATLDDLEIFWKGTVIDTSKLKKTEEIADVVINDIFDKTIVVKHDKMANMDKKDQLTYRINLNTRILDTSQKEFSYPIGKGRRAPAEATILKQTFDVNGMLKIRKDENSEFYEILEPTEGNAKEVWDKICEILKTDMPDLYLLIKTLRSPPFGISPRVIELFLAAFFRLNKPYFKIKINKKDKKEAIFNGDTINKIVKKPNNVEILFYEYHSNELKFLRLLYSGIESSSIMPHIVVLDEAGNKFLDWFDGLPDLTKYSRDLDDLSTNFIRFISDLSRKDLREFVLEGIIKALSITTNIINWDENEFKEFKKTLSNIISTLNAYPEKVELEILKTLQTIFKARSEWKPDITRSIQNWYNNLPSSLKQSKSLFEEENILLKYIRMSNNITFDLGDVFYKKLPNDLQLEDYLNWKDISNSLSNYKKKFEEIKFKIEERKKYIPTALKKEKSKTKEEKITEQKPTLSQKAIDLKSEIIKKIKNVKKWEAIEILKKIIKELEENPN